MLEPYHTGASRGSRGDGTLRVLPPFGGGNRGAGGCPSSCTLHEGAAPGTLHFSLGRGAPVLVATPVLYCEGTHDPVFEDLLTLACEMMGGDVLMRPMPGPVLGFPRCDGEPPSVPAHGRLGQIHLELYVGPIGQREGKQWIL